MIRRARMNDGTIVELTKNCGCLDSIHEGPHWIHADKLWQMSNKKMLDHGNYRGNFAGEQARISQKIFEMEKRGIDDFVADDLFPENA